MKRRKPMVSIAEPLSDDDFAAESREEAKAYADVQRAQSERERIREENKLRKQRGEAALILPKLPGKRGRSDQITKREYDLSSDSEESDEDAWLDIGGRTVKRIRRRQDDNLRYEGQVLLSFNPLYYLAGLPDPENKINETEAAKQRVVDRLTGRKSASSPARTPTKFTQLTPSGSSRQIQTSSPLSSGQVEQLVEDQEDDVEVEEEPEGDYDEEENDVVVPWGSEVQKNENGGEELEEGFYSDDEDMFSKKTNPSILTPARPETADIEDLPPFRPTFPFSDDQAKIGSFPLDDEAKDIAVPVSINRFLKAYQQVGAQFLYDHYKQGMGGVLGDDMGLGKTIQVISFLSAIMRKTGTSADFQRRKKMIRQSTEAMNPRHWPTALVVCPKSLVGNWSRELDTWGYFEYAVWRSDNSAEIRTSFIQGFLDIILVSYDTARINIGQIKDLPLSVVIVDEAHRMKEPRALATLALKKIDCKVCFALTGTLVQNRMDEMWSVLDFVHRGWAGTLKEWKEFAVNPIKKGHRHEGTVAEVITAIMRLGIMTQKILPHFYLRRDKRLIAHELPEKRDMVIFCPLAPTQIRAYQALIDCEDVQYILRRNDPCECGSGDPRIACCHPTTSNGDEVKDLLFKYLAACKKVANHFGLLYHAKDDSRKTREINREFFKICTGQDYDMKQRNVVQAALDPGNSSGTTPGRLARRIDEQQSPDILKLLAGFAVDMLTGEVANSERMEMVDRFQDQSKDHFVFLISTLAGGVGLNLTAVVIFDPDWNPANDLQAMDRAFRIGQKRTVDVYRLIGQGTVEELMYERQIHKQTRARQLNDGTFERRIHQGFDGARTAADQGELFGTQNIFRFDPNGFVSGNLERVRQAEDRFVQDLIEAEYNDSAGEDEESEEEGGRTMRDERKARDLHRAQLKAVNRREGEPIVARRRHEDVVDDLLGHGHNPGSKNDKGDILEKLGVTSRVHELAFVDSPEERAIYEIGVKVLEKHPEIAKSLKANDLGKLGRTVKRREKALLDGDTAHDAEPWQKRFREKANRSKSGLTSEEGLKEERQHKVLAELSD